MKKLFLSIIIVCLSFSVLFTEEISKNERLEIISRLEEYLSLRDNTSDMSRAYEEFYSKRFKAILAHSRGIKNSSEYVASNPKIDFATVTTLKKIKKVTVKDNMAYITAESEIYDLEYRKRYKYTQTFTMMLEDGKWVYSFNR